MIVVRTFVIWVTCVWGFAAQAQDDWDGSWIITGPDNAVLVTLDLDQTGTTISGTGRAGAGLGPYVGGVATVQAGAALGANFELEVGVRPPSTGLSPAQMRIVVFANVGTTVFFEGEVITAIMTSATVTPASPEPEVQLTGDVCMDMTTLQQTMFLQADDAMRRELDRVYDAADTQFGVESSEPRCAYLLERLTDLQSGASTGVPGGDTSGIGVRPLGASEVCDEVAPLIDLIRAEEAAAGLADDGSIQAILNDSGLGVDGVWSTGACEFGLANLREYLELISVSTFGQPLVPGNTVKDPVVSGPVEGSDIFDMMFQVRDVSETLNVRSGPSTGNGVVGQLPYFARDVRIVGQGCSPSIQTTGFATLPVGAQLSELTGRWCLVRWNGLEGWVSGRYLRPM